MMPEGVEGLDLGSPETSEGKAMSPTHMRKASSTNAKIVKHIRGGQSKFYGSLVIRL